MHASSLPLLPAAAQTPLGFEVYRGLTSRPKTLCPWLFYDQAGSALFEQITELPEYYVTRMERGILEQHADEIVERAGGPLTIIELGAGTATKTGLLLAAAVRRQRQVNYHPIDVSASALEKAKLRLQAALPEVRVLPRVADYTEGLGAISAQGQRRMVLYIGSSIGNFEPAAALDLLRDVRQQLTPGDKLLLGADMVKDPNVLRAAYDDAAGVTAAFNLNVLARINRELGADFNLGLFRHEARWNEEQARIEMHLESLCAQRVSVPALELRLPFRKGETIHTENSYKFTPERIQAMLERAGFHLGSRWSDAQQWFGVFLATAW